MRLEIATVVGFHLLGAAATGSDEGVGVYARENPEGLRVPHQARGLERREAEESFPLVWEAQDKTIFSKDWTAGDASLGLDVTCIDCRTWGNLDASVTFPEDLDDFLDVLEDFNPLDEIDVTLTFNGVGGHFELDADASLDGTKEIPLFKSESPVGISGPKFTVGLVFTVDLLIDAVGDVDVEGGFELDIPSGSTFTFSADSTKKGSAKFNGANASLLPFTVEAATNMTLTLQLGVQAGVDFSAGKLEAKAVAGAYLHIPEITIESSFSSTKDCLPAFGEANIAAGAYVDAGAELGSLEIPDFNPTAATTVFRTAASTCFSHASKATKTASSGSASKTRTSTSKVTKTGTATSGTKASTKASTGILTKTTSAMSTKKTNTSSGTGITRSTRLSSTTATQSVKLSSTKYSSSGMTTVTTMANVKA